jgi:hypothetical protein
VFSHRRELTISIVVLAVAWLVLMVVLGRWQEARRARGGPAAEPKLLHYPGTEGVQEQTVANLGWRKYWFTLEEDYPSKSAFYFYRDALESQGWRPAASGEPQWYRRKGKDEDQDLFRASWISPNRLFQIDLDMASTIKANPEGGATAGEVREPGIKVYVTLHRVLGPALLAPTAPPARGRPQIEVH